MEQVIFLSKLKRVGYITINRPKANSYEVNFMKQLSACIDEANADNDIKVLVLQSALAKFFCAGADIKVFAANDTAQNKEMVKYANQSSTKLQKSKKVTIAAIGGHCLGGGLELAMACDFRIAAEGEYLLGLPEVKLGIMPGNGGTQRLIRLIPVSKAMELLLSGDSIQPSEAYDLGLLNQLYPADSFQDKMTAYAEKLATMPLQAMTAIKQSVYQGIELTLEEGLKLERKLVDPLYDTDDAREGFVAFTEKRAPKFK